MSIALKIPKKKVTQRNRRAQRYRAVVHVGGGKYEKRAWRLTKGEAEADELALRLEIRDGAVKGTRTVAEFCDAYERAYALRHKHTSLITLKSSLKALRRDLGDVAMAGVSGEQAEAWSAKHGSAMRGVCTMWNYALERREPGVAWNPFAKLHVPSGGRENIIPLSVAEVARLAACAREEYPGEFGLELAAMVMFDAYSGLRPGELFMLTWDAVNFDADRINVDWRVYCGDVDEPKRGRQIVRLFDEARAAVRSKPRRGGEYVFTTKTGVRWAQANYAKVWGKVAERFGLRADKVGNLALVQPYELRHFMGHHIYVTLGLPARVAAAQLGHKNENEIINTYGHGEHGALEQLDRHFATPTPLRSVG